MLSESVMDLDREERTATRAVPTLGVSSIEELRKCVVCGKWFVPKRSNHVTCCKGCSKKWNVMRSNARAKANREKIRAGEVVGRVLPEPTGKVLAEDLTPANMVALVAGMFKNARQMDEMEWFETKEAMFYLDLFGIDFETRSVLHEFEYGHGIQGNRAQ